MRSFVTCEGGLGNQLFTWNAAHHLSSQPNNKVIILIPKNANRRIELLELTKYCQHDIKLKQSNFTYACLRLIDLIIYKLPNFKKLFNEIGLIIYLNPNDKIDLQKRKFAIHKGYFQNIDMVDLQANSTVMEITELATETFRKLQHKKRIPNTFEAFHIRRGDFGANFSAIGILSDEYYRKLRTDLPLVITTESHQDLTDNFGATYISTTSTDSNWESFSILAHAKRLVIANSTFSWWAGIASKYLDSDSKVIQPDRYQKDLSSGNFLLVDVFLKEQAVFE